MKRPTAQAPAMAEYGVGGPDWHPLPWDWAASRLVAARNYWLVTASASGRPHALPVWGVWDDTDLVFAFCGSPGSRKAANLAVNPQVVVAPEDTVECVSVQGRAVEVTDSGRSDWWVARYLAKYQPIEPTLTGAFIRQSRLFEVTPHRVIAVIERADEFATRATRWRF